MEPTTPRTETQDAEGGASLRVLGAWTAGRFADAAMFRHARAALAAAPAGAVWDLRGAEQIDHVGAQLLWNHWGRRWPDQLQAEPAQRAVLERVAQFTADLPAAPAPTLGDRYQALGAWVAQAGRHVRGFVRLIGQLAINVGRLVALPHTGPWRDVSGHLYRIGATAMPITALVGFLIGVVLAYLTSQQLKQFGADAYIVNILGVSLIRELGPMLAAILIAGRSGSAITAQIGVMRVTEELDARSEERRVGKEC